MPLLQDLLVNWVSVVDKAATRDPVDKSKSRRFLMMKREGTDLPPDMKGGGSVPPTATELLEKLEKADEDTLGRLSELLSKAEEPGESKANPKSKTPDKEDNPKGDSGEGAKKSEKKLKKAAREKALAELNKSELPEPVRKAIEKMEKDADARIEKAEKDAETASQLAKAERDARLERVFISKAAEFSSLSLDAEAFGPVLKSLSEKLSEDEFGAVETILKSANEQARESLLFKELGSGDVEDRGPTSALKKAETKASELRKASADLSMDQAMARVFAEDRTLQAEYLKEMRA